MFYIRYGNIIKQYKVSHSQILHDILRHDHIHRYPPMTYNWRFDVLKRRNRRLKHSVNTRHESIFSDPDVVRELSRLHENFVIVPADKASNNYTFVCKRHYVSILSEELGLNSLPGNPWEPYIQSDGSFCIRSAGQPQIGPHFIWN